MKAERLPGASGFERLLERLDTGDRDGAGRAYEQLRRRLVRFFEYRRCVFPDDQADETLSRVARKLDAGEAIQDVTTYVIGVARMVSREAGKAAMKDAAIQAAPVRETDGRLAALEADGDDEQERLLASLRACLDTLTGADRDLIVRYYQDDKQAKIRSRREIAAELGVEMNALRLRAFRIRAALESCVEARAGRRRERNGIDRHASTS